MKTEEAIQRAREVIRRQPKALATEDTHLFWLQYSGIAHSWRRRIRWLPGRRMKQLADGAEEEELGRRGLLAEVAQGHDAGGEFGQGDDVRGRKLKR
ncbi:MAG TPA: hypothetical protein VJA21_25790 [Verrucomicrobiae bacterium]